MFKFFKAIGVLILVCSLSVKLLALNNYVAATITTTGTPSAVNTVYGDPSASTSFNVSTSGLTAALLVTPPAGFEVSTDNINFNSTVSISNSGTINSAPVFLRLAAITDAGTYNGNIVLSSGTASVNIPIPNSVISPAPVTVTTKDVTKHYGEELFIASTGTGTFTVTGTMKNGDQITTVSIAYGPGYNSADNVGTYIASVTITTIAGNVSFKLSNYAITKAEGNIIILPSPLTIKLNNVTKDYGSILTNGSTSTGFTVTGLENLQTIVSLTIAYHTGASASSPVNHYMGSVTAVSPSGGNFTPGNYSVAIVPADIVVKPVPLTISANDASRDYGVNNPVFTATYTGFVNNEDVSVLSTPPSISTPATISSPAGNYPITASGASAGNYIISYMAGVLTIKALPVITLNIPNTFTPNGDGINDRWDVGNITFFPKCTVAIFNRNGQNVFRSIGYALPWDGQYNGKRLPDGTYYYVIDLKNNSKPVSGSITLVR